MKIGIDRRLFLQGSAGALSTAALSSVGASAALASGKDVRWGTLTPGFTVLLTEYILHHKLDEKNGFKLGTPTVYTSVPTYYSDFDVGNFDICIGSWDTFVVRYLAGVPCRYICSVTTGDMINILAKSGTGLDKIEDIAGKVIAAPQSTGTYRLSRAVLKEVHDIDLEKVATVQNVTNPAASVSVLRAGSANAGLTWEPNVSNGIADDPSLKVLFNVGQAYTKATGKTLPYFGVVARNELLERDPKIGAKVANLFRDCIEGILADIPAAIKVVGPRTGFRPEVLEEAIRSKRLSFAYSSMADADQRATVMAAAEFAVRNKLLPKMPDEKFFYPG